MIKKYLFVWRFLAAVADWLVVVLSFVIVEFARLGHFSLVDRGYNSAVEIGLVWVAVATIAGSYSTARRFDWAQRARGTAFTVVLSYLIASKLASKGLVFSSSIADLMVLSGALVFARQILMQAMLMRARTRGINQRRLIIYGGGRLGASIAERFISRPWMGIKVVGFIDDLRRDDIDCDGTILPVLGGSQNLRSVIQMFGAREVILALPNGSHERVMSAVHDIADLDVNVSIAPNLADLVSVRAEVEDLWGVPIVRVRQPVICGWDALAKRAFDLALAAILLVLMLPLMAIIAAAIWLDSGGPILFTQQRIGRNGRPFKMFKFRTMIPSAEALLPTLVDLGRLRLDPAFKITNDPRVTRLGKVLRRTSLDELPQLFNVLVGDMSLVGPRPEEATVVAMYSYHQRQRLAVRPGITGPMQVNGRGSMKFDRRLALELEYIQDYSFLKDIELLLKTFPAVLTGDGAR